MKLPQGLEHCVAQYVWYVPNRIRRDEDNIVLSAKPLFDGLVDFGLVPDDTPEHMTKLMPLIEPHPIKGKQSTAIRVWVAPNQRAFFAKGQDEE